MNESKYVQHYTSFGKYNQSKNVVTASGLSKLEALYTCAGKGSDLTAG